MRLFNAFCYFCTHNDNVNNKSDGMKKIYVYVYIYMERKKKDEEREK